MTAVRKVRIVIEVAPDDPNMTEQEIRDWVEIVVRGIGAVADVKIDTNALHIQTGE
jgi:hypothetical protein